MTTSLAEQLQRLAVPQTSLLTRDKKRASLLFDPKEAASLRHTDVYGIGSEGLEELITKNQVFAQFRNSLFHISSKNYDRSVQSAEANGKLNQTIKKFLLLLSPYFLLSACHKALEWLINRYMIHEYNREELLMLILPYHESNIFVRVVQVLYFKHENDSFQFLKEVQKPGIHLPKQTLLQHAASNVGFLKFVTNFILQLIKVHDRPNLLTVAFNFYCNIFCGVLEYAQEIKDTHVSQMLPLLIKGLNSQIPDFCAASYVITARLVTKTSFSDNLLDKFVEKISDTKMTSLRAEACLVLLVIYQAQNQYKGMPPTAVANLSEKEWLPQILQSLNSSGSYIYPFFEVLIKRSTEEGVNNDLKIPRDMVTSLLETVKLDSNIVPVVLHSVLDITKPKMKYSEDVKKWLTEIFQMVEKQYPDEFDKAVHNILSAPERKAKRKSCLQKILKNTMTYKGKFEVLDKLYHPQAHLRGEAVKYLTTNYNSLRETDKEVIKNAFVDRLNDDKPKVVEETLKLLGNVSILDPDVLKGTLINLANKLKVCHEPGWRNVSTLVLNMLCSEKKHDWGIFLTVFPYLLPNTEECLLSAQKLLKLPFFADNPLLKSYLNKLQTSQNCKGFTNLLFESLQKNSCIEEHTDLLKFLNNIPPVIGSAQISASVIMLTNTLPNNSPLGTSTLVLEILLKFFREREVKSADDIPFLQCLQNTISKTEKPSFNLGLTDFSGSELEYKFFVLYSAILFEDSNVLYNTRFQLLKYFCEDVEPIINFLLNICISGNKEFSAKCKINSLKYISKTLKDADDAVLKPLILLRHLTAVYLSVLLNDPDQNTRKISFNILERLIQVATRKTHSYFRLIDVTIKHKEKILMDNEQMPIIVFNLLDPNNTKRKKIDREVNNIRRSLLEVASTSDHPVYLRSEVLKLLSQINSFEIFEQTSKLVTEIIDKKTSLITGFEAIIVLTNINRIEATVLKNLTFETNIWNLLEKGITSDNIFVETNDIAKISISELVLSQLTREIFDVLSEDLFKKILDMICEVTTKTQNPEILPAANRIFKHIDLDANYILDQLVAMRDVKSAKQDTTKMRRISVIPTSDILDMTEWKKGVAMLEFIQDKKKIKNTDSLLPVLFEILKKCLDFDEQSSVEYPKQLVLSLIMLCCSRTVNENLPPNIFNMELVVQCIRASQNPQTHHHALLVLARTAEIVPTQVLHHIMAIFTFMGSSLLRHDDAYSFQIITKIIDTVIPVLVDDNRISNIAKVLRVFVDALLDIPEHRRAPLYKQLLWRIDEKENVYVFLLLVFESHVFHNNQDRQKKDLGQQRINIATNLCYEFSPAVIILACIKLLKFLKQLPIEKEDIRQHVSDEEILNLKNYSPKQFRHLKFTLLTFISSLLASKGFIDKVAALTQEETSDLENLYKEVIINVLLYIQETSNVTEKAVNTPQAQYWKRILHHSYEVLDSVNALVTPQMFLLITKGLIVHTLSTVRRKILELLNLKLEADLEYFEDCDSKDVYSLIVSLIDIIEKSQMVADQEKILQTALLSLKLLVKSQAPKDPHSFVQILEYITNLLKSGKAQHDVLGSLILCLAELCVNLRAHAISSLADFMPAILKILKKQKHQESTSWLLLSVLTTVQKLLDSLPMFLSPYLEQILTEVSILTSKWAFSSSDQKVQPFSIRLAHIKQKIGSVIPARVLIPAVEQSYGHLIEKKYFSAVKALMDIFAENLSSLKGTVATVNLPELTNFFLKALQFRSDGVASLEQANLVEAHIVKAFTVLILKLSESSFRPLYYKLFDWAVRSEEKSERLITFYSFSSGIAHSLKGLFVIFAGHFINNAAQTLDAVNVLKSENMIFEGTDKNILLLEYILQTLNAVFLYDNQKFINKDRFDILMQPLVDQLENTLDNTENLQKRNIKFVTPCIVQLFLSASNDVLWKQMNYQILLKLRNTSPEIRLVTLHCLTQIVLKLGEDFLPMLPETIPFLAELLEDEEERVEKACHKAVQEMEKVLGEPLQKYF